MLDVPQLHELSHFLRREVGRMGAQEPKPEIAIQFIDRGHDLNQPSKGRPIAIDVLPKEEQLGEAALDGLPGSMQNDVDVDNDLRTSRPWNDTVRAVTFTSTHHFNVCRGKQRVRSHICLLYTSDAADDLL